jgi:diguanylate cyclase (GGDEF)-like protein
MREAAMAMAVGRLARLATGEFAVDDMLAQLCDVAAQTMNVRGAAVMGVSSGRSRFVHASDPDLEPVGRLQEALQAGPGPAAIDSGTRVCANSAGDFAGWPAFQLVAGQLGIHTVLALPLASDGRSWGSLDLYWTDGQMYSEQESKRAQLLAEVAVSYLKLAGDRAEARAAEEQLATRVLHDQLTGLPNRGLIHELISHALAIAARHQTSLAVLFVDLDRFKAVNDTYGHLTGDVVLQEVARRLQLTVRSSDTVGRLGGDEFLILCEDRANSNEYMASVASKLADRIHAVLTEPIRIANTELTVSASVGVAVSRDRQSPADLIHAADLAMYQAKARGRVVAVGDELSAVGF